MAATRLPAGYFNGGAITRRSTLLGLAAATLMPGFSRAADDPAYPYKLKFGIMSDGPLEVVALNGITANVTSVRRTLDFYQRLYGTPVHAYQGNSPCVRVGDGPAFIKLVESATPGYERPVIAVKDFEPRRVKKILAGFGVESEIRYRMPAQGGGGPGAPNGTPELFFRDPDGLEYQIQHPSYAGGAGIHGEVVKVEPSDKVRNAVFHARTINHITNSYRDAIHMVDWFQKIFQFNILVAQGNLPTLGVGRTPIFGIGTAGKDAPPSIGHFCLGIDNYNDAEVMQKLIDFGLDPSGGSAGGGRRPLTTSNGPRQWNAYGGGFGAPLGTSQTGLTDPDGLFSHIQDVSYCTGAGPKGSICPPVGSTEMNYRPPNWRPFQPTP